MNRQTEKRPPLSRNWDQVPCLHTAGAMAESAWQRGPVRVISSLVMADLPDGAGIGPQWHVSVSRGKKRPKPYDVARALRDFDMRGAEQDNHHPGNARHFWMPVDPAHRVSCECKETEETLDDGGYAWTNPHDGEGPCRGCEFTGITGRPCPIHARAEVSL